MKKRQNNVAFEAAATGAKSGVIAEFWDFLKHNKKWWILPILLALLVLSLLVVAGGSGLAPFIYTLF